MERFRLPLLLLGTLVLGLLGGALLMTREAPPPAPSVAQQAALGCPAIPRATPLPREAAA